MMLEAEVVEAADPDQLAQVRTLLQNYQAGLPVQYRFPDSEWEALPGAYSPPGGALLLAKVADQPAGCVGLRPFPLPGACEMNRLYVAPAFRGHDLGSMLIERIVQAARGLGYTRMRLDTHLPRWERQRNCIADSASSRCPPNPCRKLKACRTWDSNFKPSRASHGPASRVWQD
jgi:GNAT superfamily N-acetyltransferase